MSVSDDTGASDILIPELVVSDQSPPAGQDTGAGEILIPELVVSNQSPWYAVWTRSRAEKSVVEQLERKQIEVFLPTIQRWSRWKDRKKKVEWPLFPGYCFARFDRRAALDVRKCVGVATIISFDGDLAPIPHAEIEAIQRIVSSELQFDPCPLLREGDMVEVIHGPLTGVTGRLIRKGPKTVLLVAITMINRGVEVRLDAADVRKY